MRIEDQELLYSLVGVVCLEAVLLLQVLESNCKELPLVSEHLLPYILDHLSRGYNHCLLLFLALGLVLLQLSNQHLHFGVSELSCLFVLSLVYFESLSFRKLLQ